MTNIDDKTMVSIDTAADMLEVNRGIIVAAIRRGELPATVSTADLRAWFDALDDAQDTA